MHNNENTIPHTMVQEAVPLPGNGKFHVRLVEGFYQNLRRLISWPMIALFFVMAWLKVDGKPLVLFDFTSHRIFLFGAEFSWYDLPIMAGLMIAGASLLFFMAVGWGRVWCGFACPQSIWTWLFIRLEDLTEGRAAKRAKYEGKPLTGLRLVRRILKHLSWVLLSVATAVTFSGYFVPIDLLIKNLVTLEASLFSLSWIITMALLTYINAGLVREKVCLHMCPYSRFQGVMFDSDTRTVTYDRSRGEPRRGVRKSSTDSQAGDCVDCNICVQVCPTGIDIRDGLQAACIDCGACIDACDTVMKKIGKPTGLIEFYSEKQLDPAVSQQEASKLLRPRLLGYLSVMVITVWGVFYGLNNRTDLLIEIARDRGQLYVQQGDQICNSYQVELEAFNETLTSVAVTLQQPENDVAFTLVGPAEVALNNLSTTTIYQVCTQADDLAPRNRIEFKFSNGQQSYQKQTTFIAPTSG